MGHHHRHRLAVEVHLIVLEHVKAFPHRRIDRALVREISEPRGIEMADHCDQSGQTQYARVANVRYAAAADARADDDSMGLTRLVEFRSVEGRARHLGTPVDTGERLADHRSIHATSPAI